MNKRKAYKKYITSAAWRIKRHQALVHYGNRCAGCGGRRNLDVHHITYVRFGRERLEDLILLCHNEHMDLHMQHRKIGRKIPLELFTKQYLRKTRNGK